MKDCLLANGGSPIDPLWIVVGLVSVIFGVVLVSRRHGGLRGVTSLLGLLVAAVLVTTVLGTVPAQADGPTSCATPSATPTVAAATLVTPLAATLAEALCNVSPAVVTPDVVGVAYTQRRVGNVVTVTATPKTGYVFPPGAVTSWALDTTPAPCTCTPVPPGDETYATLIPTAVDQPGVASIDYIGTVSKSVPTVEPAAWVQAWLARPNGDITVTYIVQNTYSIQWYDENGVPVGGILPIAVNYTVTFSHASMGPDGVVFASVVTTGQSLADLLLPSLPDHVNGYFDRINDDYTPSSSVKATADGACVDLGGLSFAAGSDVRIKTDITALGTTVHGLTLYSFRYTADPTRQIYVGVMAQDVLTVNPAAVVTGPDGFYRVRYGLLGLRMLTWQQYAAGMSVTI